MPRTPPRKLATTLRSAGGAIRFPATRRFRRLGVRVVYEVGEERGIGPGFDERGDDGDVFGAEVLAIFYASLEFSLERLSVGAVFNERANRPSAFFRFGLLDERVVERAAFVVKLVADFHSKRFFEGNAAFMRSARDSAEPNRDRRREQKNAENGERNFRFFVSGRRATPLIALFVERENRRRNVASSSASLV